MVDGQDREQQQRMLKELFLEVDKQMSMDEGCTATVLLAERESGGALALQTANVGDSSVVLINLTRCEGASGAAVP